MTPLAFDPTDFLESGPLVPFVMDTKETLLWVGPQAVDLLGYPAERWMDPGFWDEIVVDDDLGQVRDARRGGAASGTGVSVEYRVRKADGVVLWLAEVGRVASADGQLRIHGYLYDVTERKLREVALWKSEERIRSVLRNAPDAMVLTGADGRVQNMNARAESLFQYQLADIAGSLIDPLVPERLRARFRELREAFADDSERRSLVVGEAFAIEQREGVEVPVEIGMSRVAGLDGEDQILNSFRDLTARRRVEAQLRSSERRVRQIANVLPAMVCFVDGEERFRFVNDAYAEWYGWQRHQMEGRRVREVIGESAYAEVEPAFRAALAGTATHVRGEVADAAGATRSVDMSFVPQFDEKDAVDGFFSVVFDVTSEVRAEQADRLHREELAHVARVATLGELAASIAHELNQPLSAVVANAQAARRLLDRDSPDIGEARAALEDVASDARRAGDVISSMRQLLQRGETRQEALDLQRLVSDVVELVHSEAVLRGVEVRVSPAEDVATEVQGDAAQLTQVFLNLVKNGIESTSRLPTVPRRVTVGFVAVGGSVEVHVTDNGPGFGSDDLEGLFQPFVTGRPDGLGMGLTISRTITEAHGGSVVAENVPGGGARLRVRLPLSDRDRRPTPDG